MESYEIQDLGYVCKMKEGTNWSFALCWELPMVFSHFLLSPYKEGIDDFKDWKAATRKVKIQTLLKCSVLTLSCSARIQVPLELVLAVSLE